MSLDALGLILGKTKQAISQWEQGVSRPDLEWLMDNRKGAGQRAEFCREVLTVLYPDIIISA